MDSPIATDVLMSFGDILLIVLSIAFVVLAGYGIAACIRGSGACSFLTQGNENERGAQ